MIKKKIDIDSNEEVKKKKKEKSNKGNKSNTNHKE